MKIFNNLKIRYIDGDISKINFIKQSIINIARKGTKLTDEEILKKIKFERTTSSGLENNVIYILNVLIVNPKLSSAFLDYIIDKLSIKDYNFLKESTESRLDENLSFYIRLDIDEFFKNNLVLTDSGKCLHLNFNVSAHPAKYENALSLMNSYFETRD